MKNHASGDIEFAESAGIARLGLNRPSKANSISMDMLEAIVDIIDGMAAKEDAKALVIAAAGRNFCGGVDLAIMDPAITSEDVRTRYLMLWDRMIDGLQSLPVPVIGAIQGPAIAGGLSIAFACHLRIASANARFGYPRISQGHAPGRHNLTNLVRTIGPGRTRLVLLGARILEAQEALEWGLVDLLVEPDRLEPEVEAVLDKLRATPQRLVSITHRLISDPADDSLWAETSSF